MGLAVHGADLGRPGAGDSDFDARRRRESDRMRAGGWPLEVATAILAGVIAKLTIFAPGVLATVPLPVRLAAVAAGFAAFMLVRRSVLAGVLVGEFALVAGALLFGQ